MGMKKADMEADYDAYYHALGIAKLAEKSGMYRTAMEAALAAWGYLDGMIQYARKYQNQEFADVAAIDHVLRYAPLLLDMKSLDKLERLLEETKRIVRNSADDLEARLSTSRANVWDNHLLWSHLESFPEARQDEFRRHIGGQQEYWRWVVEAWEKMGLVTRIADGNSYKVALATRMGQVVRGKCPTCGSCSEAPKAMLFEPTRCPQCKSKVSFVILPQDAGERNGSTT